MKPRILSTARISFPLATALAALLAAPSATAADGTWLGATGNWTDAGTWSGGTIADGTGFTANFTGVDIAADQTITLVADRTIGNITFTDSTTASNNLLITGANILTLDVASGAPVIDVTQSGRTLTINSVIAGNDGLQKSGTGALTLNGSAVNTITGGLNVSRGTLALDYASLATPTDLVAATNALQINSAALTITGKNAAGTTNQTFASTTLGAGANTINITKGAAATSANLILGALTITPGSASVFNTATGWPVTVLPTAETVKISAGGSVPALPGAGNFAYVNAGLFYRTTVNTAGTARYVAVNSGGNLLGQLVGTAPLTATNSTNVPNALNATLAFTTTTASSYALVLNAGSNPNTLTLAAGGTLTLNGMVQSQPTNGAVIAAGTGASNIIIGSERNLVINMDNSAPLTINAPIANNGGGASAVTIASTALSATTPGTVTLGGVNTYTGPTTITRGTLALSNASALSTTSGLTLGGTSAATLSNSGDITGISTAAPITVANSGVTSTISYSRTTAAQGSISLLGGITGGGGNVTFTTPNVSSGGNVQSIILGGGVGSAGGYGGSTTLTTGNAGNAMQLRVGTTNALPTTTVLTFAQNAGSGTGRATTLNLQGFNQTLAGLSNTGNVPDSRNMTVTSGTAATLTINNTADFTFGGRSIIGGVNTAAQITGAISLVKNGAGTFTLGGTLVGGATAPGNAFTGSTQILGGILVLGESNSIQNSAFDTAGSVAGDATNGLRAGIGGTGVTALTLGGLTGGNAFSTRFTTTSGGYTGLTSLTLNPGSGVTHTYSADIGNGAGALNLTKSGAGTQILAVPQTYTGTTTSTGGALVGTTTAALPGYNIPGQMIFNGGAIGGQVGGAGWTTGEMDTLLTNATKTSGALGIDTTNGNLVQWTPFTTTNFGSLGLNKLGANDLTLNQANTYTGTTTVTAGTLTLSNALALQNSTLVTTGAGTVVLSGVTTVNLSGLSGATGNLGTIITGYGGVTAITLNTPEGVSLTYGGNITEGAAGTTLTKTGAGIQTLTGTNNYTGVTQINGGMLVFGNKASKAAATATAAAAGSVGLGVHNSTATFYSAIEVGNLFNTNTLAGFNLNAASGVAIDTTNAGTSFDQNVALTAARSLTKFGANTLILSTANAYSGATTVTAGNLSITNNDSLGTTAGSTTIIGGNFITGNTLSLTDATSGLTVAEALNFSGNTVGRARLANNSAQNHTLSGNINVTSDTNIVEFNSTGTGSITLSGNITGTFTNTATLFLRGTSTSANNWLTGNITLVDGALSKTDAGTWTIGAVGKTINASGGISVTNGTLKLGAADTLADTSILTMGAATGTNTGSFDLNGFNETIGGITQLGTIGAKTITNSGGAAVLTVNNATNYSTGTLVALTGSLGLTKQGLGTLTLDGANTYSGNTIVSAGTLALADNAQLKFTLGASTVSNNLTGPGTATLDGDFVIDTAAADALATGTWTLENVTSLTGAYGSTFSVVGFLDAGGNKWTKANGLTKTYTFDEVTGILTLAPAADYSAWATINGASLTNLSEDHDNDGVDNGTEYFIGGTTLPQANTTGFTALPSVVNTAGVLSVTFTKAASYTGTYGIDFVVETSATLTGVWAPEASPGTVTIAGNEVKYTFPVGTKNFARLKVTGP